MNSEDSQDVKEVSSSKDADGESEQSELSSNEMPSQEAKAAMTRTPISEEIHQGRETLELIEEDD